jgi:hypothetical protein
MKSFSLCFALAVLPAFAGQREAVLPPIALYTQFLQEVPAAVVESLETEVAAIMAPMGLHFNWRDLAATSGSQVSVELAVISFKGRCNVAGLTPHDSSSGVLGWTHISDGVILPFADVDCDAVRGFIQKQLLAVRMEDRAPAFGRALGRVLAHELYHIFANTTHHGTEGVARESYNAQDLLAPDFQFEARESMALINGKAHLALANAAAAEAEPQPADRH